MKDIEVLRKLSIENDPFDSKVKKLYDTIIDAAKISIEETGHSVFSYHVYDYSEGVVAQVKEKLKEEGFIDINMLERTNKYIISFGW